MPFFAAHSYKFNKTTSTFIVECDPQTWSAAGFNDLNDEQTRSYLGEVFKEDLNGAALLSNNSKWIQFALVKNSTWFFENVVLLGDALHTAHFSIGSGTKLALEDAIALTDCFMQASLVQKALQDFATSRRLSSRIIRLRPESMVWFENARKYMHLSPVQLAFSLMTRSGRVSREDLVLCDPAFVAG